MKELIDIFNSIRRIPYKIVDIEYSLENSYDLIYNEGASCTPKHLVLEDKIKALGLETRFCIHEFKWADFNFNFSESLLKLFKLIPYDFHTNVEVKIDNNWVLVDATWDDALIKAGLPGTLNWDGQGPTSNCVHSLKEYKFITIEERAAFIKHEMKKIALSPEVESKFIFELNDFLNRIRTKSGSHIK